MKKYDIKKELEASIEREAYSWYLYKGIGIWAKLKGFEGTARFAFKQAQEEAQHMEKFIEFALDRNIEIELPPISQPSFRKGTLKELFMQAYQQEKSVTKGIHEFYEKALQNGDHATAIFLQWFIMEQVEEERQIEEILQVIEQCGMEPPGLYLADRAIGERKKD